MDELAKNGLQAEAECPDCLKFLAHTPVEKWKETEMKYCTFHYWIMKGREGGFFTLGLYVERSKYFGFITSLPSSEDIAKMMSQSESPVISSTKARRELAVIPVVS